MFGWLRNRTKRIEPEAGWIFTIDDEAFGVTDDAGRSSRLATHAIAGVAIETNDSGPWGTDLWWLLFDADDRLALTFPGGATGDGDAAAYFSSLPGFTHEKLIAAMRSTDNAIFPLWRKGG